jgi:hypothetical protein
MTKCKDRSDSRGQRRRAISLVVSACVLGACAAEPTTVSSDDPEDVRATTSDSTAAVSGEGAAPLLDGEIGPRVGCTHIRFCTEPGTPNWIICDTNDKACSSNARYNECRSDALAVCGRLTPMIFDPAIPCPITGVCSSGELGFIGFP